MIASIAQATPASTPQALAEAFKVQTAAKNCAGVLALFDFTNITPFMRSQIKAMMCSFSVPIVDIKYVASAEDRTLHVQTEGEPEAPYNLPVVGALKVTFEGDHAPSASLPVGQKGGQYLIASKMTAELEKKYGTP